MSALASQGQKLLKTPLWGLHYARGGKMVPFAGYDMPVQYNDLGVLKEHLHTRQSAGLFDVSHMGQAFFTAPTGDPAALIEKLVPGDIQGLKKGQMRYTVLLNDQGGIIDDLIITRWDDKTLYMVVNAACKDRDFAYIRQKLGSSATLTPLPDRALVALQGPLAESVLAQHYLDVTKMSFMTAIETGEAFITRSGYTGEDGFEISLPEKSVAAFAEKLLTDARVRLIGLGARDSLRLEAGLCLYGHDLNDSTSPVEANLKWVIAKRRREEANFAGAARIIKELKDGTSRLRVGIKPDGKAPVREGTELLTPDGRKVGTITSGGFGPTVDGPVAMGYVETDLAATGTKLNAILRGTPRPAEIATLPFIKTNYKKA
jgi:aminomethyltransferase